MTKNYRVMTPWALAAVAKESVMSGNEHRRSGTTPRDILEMCAAFASLDDPLSHGNTELGTPSSFFMRLASEQFPTQVSPFEDIARVELFTGDALAKTTTEIISPKQLEVLLGCDILDFVGAGFLFTVGAQKNGGYFDPAWLEQSNFEPIRRVIPRERLLDIFHRHFAATPEELRAAHERHRDRTRRLRRYEFNPLVARPFVKMHDGRYLAPQPHLVTQRLSLSTLYYLGADAIGDAFTRDFGRMFETYIGMQLSQLLDDVSVHGETVYGGDQRGVDWIIVWPDLVVLVEVKSSRLTLSARMGMPQMGDDFDRAIGKAFRQVDRTAAMIQSEHRAFAHVPHDRPIIGLVVTLEPFWIANSPLARSVMTTPEPRVPTLVASAREVERLVSVALASPVAPVLTALTLDHERRTWSLGAALQDLPSERNPLLDAAWARYPWKESA